MRRRPHEKSRLAIRHLPPTAKHSTSLPRHALPTTDDARTDRAALHHGMPLCVDLPMHRRPSVPYHAPPCAVWLRMRHPDHVLPRMSPSALHPLPASALSPTPASPRAPASLAPSAIPLDLDAAHATMTSSSQ